MIDRRSRVWTWGLCALLVGNLPACSSDSAEPSSPDAGEGAGRSGGTGGSGGTGSKPPSLLPNLSTAGQEASGGSSASSGAGASAPAQCKFIELGPCVTSALDEAVACLQAGRVGVFSSDRASCSFAAAGGEVEFIAPFEKTGKGHRIQFDLRVAGRSCAKFTLADATDPYADRYELVTPNHQLTYLLGFERHLECDGASQDYKGTDLSSCPSTSFEVPSPLITEAVTGMLSFELQRRGRIDKVFTCTVE